MSRKATAEIEVALATLQATRRPDGSLNWSRAAREAGCSINALKGWHRAQHDDSSLVNDELVTTLATELRDDMLDKTKRVRHALLDRLLDLAPTLKDASTIVNAFRSLGDDHRLSTGQPTEVSRVETTQRELPDRAAAAAAEALRRRGIIN